MSQLRRRHHQRLATLELTPLVDVALMLVVFLLLSSGMVAPEEQYLEVTLPVTASGDEAVGETMTLSVAASGALYFAGRTLDLDQLAEVVGEDSSRLTVVLRADRDSRHGRVMEILDVLRGMGVRRVYSASDQGPETW